MAVLNSHLSSNFSVLGDEIREKTKTDVGFSRECCIRKQNLRESDLYRNEDWHRPKSGRVKEPYTNYKYEFKSGGMTVFEMTKRKGMKFKSRKINNAIFITLFFKAFHQSIIKLPVKK